MAEWTAEELAFLKKNYEIMPKKDLVEQLHRHPLGCIYRKAQQLGLKKSLHRWSQDEENYLVKNYAIASKVALLANLKHYSWTAIVCKACSLGLNRMNLWTPSELQILKEVYPNSSKEEIMKALPGRAWWCIGPKALELKLKRKNPNWFRRIKLKDGYQNLTTELAQFLGNLSGDGHVGRNIIEYACIFPDSSQHFIDIVEKQFGLKGRRYDGHIIVFSRELVDFCNKLWHGKAGHRVVRVPEIIKNTGKEYKAEFIKYLFGDDGTCFLDKWTIKVELSSTSTTLLRDVQKMLIEDFGIESKINKGGKRTKESHAQAYHLFVRKIYSVKKFCEQIGFSPFARCEGGRNKGKFKQQVLQEAVNKKFNRKCIDCGADISNCRSKSVRCEKCRKKIDSRNYKARLKARKIAQGKD
ncbi:MAG: hypothetical protein NT067_06895 [Candidatus Diapherotrites archaeon]|nr:hypothetical protein [Candidatus Diapherotrites archaeon]